MKKKQTAKQWIGNIVGILCAVIIFIVPFYFMFVNSLKGRKEANLLSIALPDRLQWENYWEVLTMNNGIVLTAFKNSTLLMVGSVIVLIITCSMAGYVLQRKKNKVMSIVNAVFLIGLMVSPAILPTIWVMQGLGIYKTLVGMILVEVALNIPFTVMLYRGYMGFIPVELEEAGYIDGCTKFQMFTKIIFPLLKPATATVTILTAVTVFNDFANPLYFLPGTKNATVQLTLYNFTSQYASSYNLLFADVILITIPMLILFIIFNKKIIDGMVAGAVKS
ncbi:carbohydrate ABC transporter permease [Lachnospiraceae bacterium ZAX-1]